MAGFGWLHFTDLHRGMSEQHGAWPDWQDKLLDDLRGLHRRSGPWDMVLFTGDLTNHGTAAEFESVDCFIDQLSRLLREVQHDHPATLLAVPGNHDLERPNPNNAAWEAEMDLLDDWQRKPKVRKRFWESDSRYRKVVDHAFANYRTWWQKVSLRGSNVATITEGMLPGDFAASLHSDGLKLGVVGLNSAFLQLRSDDYRSRLAIDPVQFNAACGGDGPRWAREHDVCLLLTHHPPDWLSPEAREALAGQIIHDRFALHLFGHMHETSMRSLTLGGGTPNRSFQGRSLFGLDGWSADGAASERSYGYAVGRIDIAGESAELRLWPRTVQTQRGGQWHFIADQDACHLDEEKGNCTRAERFELHRRLAEPGRGRGRSTPAAARRADTPSARQGSARANPISGPAQSLHRGPVPAPITAEQLASVGIQAIFTDYASVEPEILERLRTSAGPIRLFLQIGNRDIASKNTVADLIEEAGIAKTVDIRILHASEDSPLFSPDRLLSLRKNPEAIRDSLRAVNAALTRLEKTAGGSVRHRKHRFPFLWRIYGFDNELYLMPYYSTKNAIMNSPVVVFRKAPRSLFNTFIDWFDYMWDAHAPKDVHISDMVTPVTPGGAALFLSWEGRHVFGIPRRDVASESRYIRFYGLGGKRIGPEESWVDCAVREANEESNQAVVRLIDSRVTDLWKPDGTIERIRLVGERCTPSLILEKRHHTGNGAMQNEGQSYYVVAFEGELGKRPVAAGDVAAMVFMTNEHLLAATRNDATIRDLLRDGMWLEPAQGLEIDPDRILVPHGTAAYLCRKSYREQWG